MTYRQKLVTSQLKDAKEWMDIWNQGTDKLTLPSNQYVGEYPVLPSLFTLASEIRKANPALKFCSLGGPSYWGEHRVFSRLYVYMDGHEYVLGEIGYGDYRIRNRSDGTVNKFMVASRKIENAKVKGGYEQMHMALTESLKVAVKNACKYLVPHTLEEVAQFTFSGFGGDLRKARGEIINNAREFVDNCRPYNVVRAELTNLIRLGVQFVTPEFKRAAEEMFKADSEAEEAKARRVGAYFVQFKEYVGVMRANVLTFDQNFANDSQYHMDTPFKSEQMIASELPADMQAKIAMLSMVEEYVSIPGIGMKASATSFWIEREV